MNTLPKTHWSTQNQRLSLNRSMAWIGVLLLTSAGVSRGCSVMVTITLPYARGETPGIAKPIARDLSARDAAIALAIAGAPLLLAALWTGEVTVFASALSGAAAITAWMLRRLRLRLGGYTGDCLGAVQQLAELAFLIGALAMLAGGEAAPGEGPAAGSLD